MVFSRSAFTGAAHEFSHSIVYPKVGIQGFAHFLEEMVTQKCENGLPPRRTRQVWKLI